MTAPPPSSHRGASGPGVATTELAAVTAFRLGRLGLILGAVALSSVAGHALIYGLGFDVPLTITVLAPRLMIAACGALVFWIARERSRWPALLRAGPVFELIGAASLAITEATVQLDLGGIWLGASWVVVWTALFRIFLPYPPRKAMLLSIAAALTVPAADGLCLAFGGQLHLGSTTINAIQTLGWALLLSNVGRWLTDLQRAASEAREQVRVLGSYQLGEVLGEGGMGVVYRAHHRMLKRDAAIKLIRLPDDIDPGRAGRSIVRFEREAQATAALRSVHTITIYDFGVNDDGDFYYVMELLEGMDLNRLVQRHGPVTSPRAVYILEQACRSLAEAHEAGLVHRDLKPANLFLCQLGFERDVVKVMDFGLVRRLALELGEHDGDRDQLSRTLGPLTMDGTICGTPGFMSPEQARDEEVDGRSDIYALGCIAYWLVAGRPVFEADNILVLLALHIETAPAPPSTRGVALSPELEQLILDCLAKAPGDRPPTAQAVMARLAATPEAGTWTAADAQAVWEEQRPGALRSEPNAARGDPRPKIAERVGEERADRVHFGRASRPITPQPDDAEREVATMPLTIPLLDPGREDCDLEQSGP